MKNLFRLLVFFSVAISYGQTTIELGCGEQSFLAGQIYEIDTLRVDCVRTMLVQEGAVVNIKHVEFVDGNTYYNGVGLNVKWGDSRDTIARADMVAMPQTDSEGNEYTDYRHPDADLPIVNFECRPPSLTVGDYVTVNGEECTTEIDENDLAAITEDTVIQLYSLTGQLVYEGLYEGLFNGDCGAGCLGERYWNEIFLMRWINESGYQYSKKWIQVR